MDKTRQDKRRMSIERNALTSLLLSFILAGILAWMVNKALVQMSQNADQLFHSNTVMDAEDSLMAHMADVETGARGYIITGDVSYLEPHEQGLRVVYGLRNKLALLLAGEPSEQSRLAELNKRLDAKIAVSQANVQARKQGFEVARTRVMAGAGKREMDALRAILGEMIEAQSEHREELRSQRQVIIADLKRDMVIVAVLFFAISIYLHFRIWRMAKIMHKAEQQVRHLATHDVLTGLPNRRLMLEHLNRAMQRCVRHKKGMALLFLDLNGFKPVNDKYGHKAGDELLKQVAQRLSDAMRASDMVARLGGDEFVVLVEDVTGNEDVCDIARKINAEIERPILLKEWGEVAISSSIGVAIYPRDGEDVETLLSNADTAMYEAKRSHSNCFCKDQKQLRRCMVKDDGENK